MESIKVLKRKFTTEYGFIRIVPLGCIHVGHKKHLTDKFNGFIDYIKKTKDTYTIIMADTVENVLPETAARHRGSHYDQNLDPEEQREQAVKLLEPIADKILFSVEGNHSRRSWLEAQFSVEKYIARELGVPFLGIDALYHARVGNNIYKIHATHGVGATRHIYSVAGKLEAQSNRVTGADIYLRSHHHAKMIFDRQIRDAKTGDLRKVLYGAVGCFLGYTDSYAHRGEMNVVMPGAIKVKLYEKEWDIHATI